MNECSRDTLHKKIVNIIEPLLVEEHLDLIDVQVHPVKKGGLLKIIIDKPGGVTIDDCQAVSNRLNYLLDVEDFPFTSYRLEVSSPGIFCELKKCNDYLRNKGKRILVQYRDLDERSLTLQGILNDYNDTHLTLINEAGDSISIESGHISKARLDPLIFPKSHHRSVKAKRGKK